MDEYRREMRRRPVMITTVPVATPMNRSRTRGLTRRRNRIPAYRTRAVRSEQLEEQAEQQRQDEQDDASPSNSSSDSDDSTALEEDIKTSSSSSDSESSGYSDWVADHGVTLEPPKRSKRKPVKKRPLTPLSDDDKKRSTRRKKVHQTKLVQGEIPELFKPPDWLSEVIPRKAPYYPQMGDEIVYFRQGHQLYINAVKQKNVYEIGPKNVPWTKAQIRV